MKPLHASSGDLRADRRADYAEMLHSSGEHVAAADLMLGALDLAPGWALGWFRLGEMLEDAGLLDRAAEAWAMSLKLDPSDRAGSALKLALIGRGPAGSAPPSAFVEALFDQYAGTFEEALTGRLEYRIPEFLEAAIRARGARRYRLALDLGCGTGLMGERLRPCVERLEGFDISAKMLRKAGDKSIYDRLEKIDLQVLRYEGARADLITAADVFMYVGALEGIAAAVTRLLADDGLFAFSVERLDGEGDFALQASRRFAHSERYVRTVLATNGLCVHSLEQRIIRRDRHEPVQGLVVVAGRRLP
jgi:predicted TPR repeat methyltransferase